MGVRLDKDWIDLNAEAVARLPGQLGVYEVADRRGVVVYIGFAGGRSRFGLRGEVESWLGRAERFRFEVNMQYTTRYRELLMAHQADHGRLPAENTDPPSLGRLHTE